MVKKYLSLKILLFCTTSAADEVVDIEFSSPLFCENDRKSIAYVIVSFNIDSFSKATDIAYFTDGYPNVVGPDFYSAYRSKVENNVFTVELKKLVGTRASDFQPQKSGPLAKCSVTVIQDWKTKINRTQDVKVFETEDFDAQCKFPLDARKFCQTSVDLESQLFLSNPTDGKKLRYDRTFRYRAWDE